MIRIILLASIIVLASPSNPARAQFCPGASGWVFDDVPASDAFCGYITWAAQNGVTGGCQVIDGGHRLYCPNDGVPRSQMAAFMSRLMDMQHSTSASVGVIRKSGVPFLHDYGAENTFLGSSSGNFSTVGVSNTGLGNATLSLNTTGTNNVAVGSFSLFSNSTGSLNTAVGSGALVGNNGGNSNVAVGMFALSGSLTGGENVAVGNHAQGSGLSASRNVAVGHLALLSNVDSVGNTAVGHGSLQLSRGARNVAIGANAGRNLLDGNDNIYIGSDGLDLDSQTIRLGNADQVRAFVAGIRDVTTGMNNGVNVVIDSDGQLGTISSSRDGKDHIADMSDASSALMQLRPVTFHYKADHDPAGQRLQYGLIAEEVAQVYPGMVASKDGKSETVMYQYLAPMLLNEYQKQQRTIEEQAKVLEGQRVEIAKLRAAVEVLMARTAASAHLAVR